MEFIRENSAMLTYFSWGNFICYSLKKSYTQEDLSFILFKVMLEFKENISLLPYNTLRIDVKARYFVEISTLEELQEFLKTPFFSMKKCILG